MGLVNRCAHDANSKCWILYVCRVYLAKDAQTRQFFNVLHSLKVFSTTRTESGELVFFVQTDR